MITAVTGLPGVGKTFWIQEQMAKAKGQVSYFSPRTESFPIDAVYLQSEYPHLQILTVEDLEHIPETSNIYIELPWYLDLLSLEPFLEKLHCHRVAILPAHLNYTGWHNWADEVIPSVLSDAPEKFNLNIEKSLQIHRGILTGEVLDYASLDTFWQELIQRAYGEIIRVKGIFNIFDGQLIYGQFMQGHPHQEFLSLNFPRHLAGKPTRFSGFEIVGRNLEKAAIAQTIHDCCLPESAILYYQQQVQASLELEVSR
jgi:hypothetical protein